tara:strand:+ start:565 stop:714 length:150 start_codon:yes stop_codon:yes gene_type:complete
MISMGGDGSALKTAINASIAICCQRDMSCFPRRKGRSRKRTKKMTPRLE